MHALLRNDLRVEIQKHIIICVKNVYKTSFLMPYDDTGFNTQTNLGSCWLCQFFEDDLFCCARKAWAYF